MKIQVCIDEEGSYRPALDLCLALEFTNQSYLLSHVVTPITHLVPSIGPTELSLASAESELVDLGKRMVAEASSALPAGVHFETRVVEGLPAESLLLLGETEQTDLFVLGGKHRGRISYYLNSIGRALAVGSQKSILIAKQPAKKSGPLTAVFATDHSEYSCKCLKMFREWGAKGIGELHLVTAYEISEGPLSVLKRNLKVNADVEQLISKDLARQSNKERSELCDAGFNTTFEVTQGHPNEVLPRAMKQHNADLLIIGARGHGFFDQLLVGSVSLHQLAREDYSVLLVRA